MITIQSKTRIVLHDFMMGGGLGLKNLNLLLYALVYGFWSNGREMFQSCSTIAKLTGYTREAVTRSLNELEEAKFIVRLPLKGRYGNNYYTINETTLNETLSTRCDETAQVTQVRCDETAQVPVIIPHNEVCENRTGACDNTAHNPIIHKETNEKGDMNTTEIPPLPLNCSNDEECVRLWKIIVTSSKWASRSEEALAEATKVLADQPVAVCRLMLAHTVEGDYPRIYEPTDGMKQKAKSIKPRCAEKSHLPSVEIDNDESVFAAIYPNMPHELIDKVFTSGIGRTLRFSRVNGSVSIRCSPEVKSWLNEKPDLLNSVLQKWVGQNYSGYDFID